MSGHPATYEAKVKKYINVFYGLIALTVVEICMVFLPIPHLYVALLVMVFSCAKAVVVGWYYMHLEYETGWLKFVVCLPLMAFGYAFFLSIDTHYRPISVYSSEPARVLPAHEHDEEASTEHGAESESSHSEEPAHSDESAEGAEHAKEGAASEEAASPTTEAPAEKPKSAADEYR